MEHSGERASMGIATRILAPCKSCFCVPEGRAIIAQCFSIGDPFPNCLSPEGTADRASVLSTVPAGLRT